VPEPERTEQWIFTFDSATGEVCRVEKLDRLSGAVDELSEPEYAALNSYLGALDPEPVPTVCAARESALDTAARSKAYLRGVADCAALYWQQGLGL